MFQQTPSSPVFGLFPKTERMVFHWDTGGSESAIPPMGPITWLQRQLS